MAEAVRTQARALTGLVPAFMAVLAVAGLGACSSARAEDTIVARPLPVAGASGASGASGKGSRVSMNGKFLHISCTRSLRDLAHNKMECFGNVYIRRPKELLTSDYAIMDLTTEQLHAEGNVVYFTPDTVIYGSKMDFNFITETGVITDGRVESDKYQLVGERIERRAIDHFYTEDGEYTTCRDCPASWKLAGKTIDFTVDGYAWLKQVFIKINDAPALYLPLAVVPVKTKRQSGFLFPRNLQLTGPNGFAFVEPFFWAISRNTDATIGMGNYSQRGLKGELEYRYILKPGSQGQLDAFYLRDRAFVRQPFYSRWAADYEHSIDLPLGVVSKVNYLDASDRDYARNIGDIPGRGEPSLVQEASFSKTGRDVSLWTDVKIVHNLVTPQLVGIDPNTVNLLPGFSVATTDHEVISGSHLYWGMTGDYARFYRIGATFDPIYPASAAGVAAPPPSQNFFLPGVTPLRRAQRFNLVPEAYYLARIGDYLEITPSAQYRMYGYLFDRGVVPPTSRGYVLLQTEIATSVEKVYGERIKHIFRPSITYSNIPVVQQNNQHPFIQQIQTAGNEFDEFDIVPISYGTQLYFVPLGNSLSYQLGNKFIYKRADGVYRKVLDVVSGESVDFTQFHYGQRLQSLSRFYTIATLETMRITSHAEYYYYPAIRAPTYNLSLSYIFARYLRRVLSFERSVTLGYSYNQVTTNSYSVGAGFNWSINDYIAFSAGIGYAFPTVQNMALSPGVVQSVSGGITFQSPSQCYKFSLLASRTVDNPQLAVTFNFPLNLSGEGFTDLQQGGGALPNQDTSGPPQSH